MSWVAILCDAKKIFDKIHCIPSPKEGSTQALVIFNYLVDNDSVSRVLKRWESIHEII